MNNELYDHIREALERSLKPYTPDEHTFVLEVAGLATKAASGFMEELTEALGHAQKTVREMSKVDTGANAS